MYADNVDEIKEFVRVLRHRAERTEYAERQRKLLALADKWDTRADEAAAGTVRKLKLFV